MTDNAGLRSLVAAFVIALFLAGSVALRSDAAPPVSTANPLAQALRQATRARALLPKNAPPAAIRAASIALADAHYAMATDAARRGDYTAALREYDAAYRLDSVYRQTDAGFDLGGIGIAHVRRGENAEAVPFFERAAASFRRSGNRKNEAIARQNLGVALVESNQTARAVRVFPDAIILFDALGDAGSAGETGVYLAKAQGLLGNNLGAVSAYDAAIPRLHRAGNTADEATARNDCGMVLYALERYETAELRFNEALALYQTLRDPFGQATALNNLGNVCAGRSRFGAAARYYEQSLPLWQAANAPLSSCRTLSNLGNLWGSIGQYQKAALYFDRALPLAREARDEGAEAAVLNNSGLVSLRLAKPGEALPRFERATVLFHRTGNRGDEVAALLNIAVAHGALGHAAQEKQFLNRTLAFARALPSHRAETAVLMALGGVAYRGGDFDAATRYAHAGLAASRAIGDRQLEAAHLANLLMLYSDTRNPGARPALAAFWGKEAIGVLQGVRGDLHGLDDTAKSAYTVSVAGTYRALADCLIAAGRLPEAQEVLDLLKAQERRDFENRPGETRGNAVTETLAATPAESRFAAEYEAFAAQITALGLQRERLEKRPPPLPPADAATLAGVRAKLGVANTAFSRFLETLGEGFAGAGGRKDETAALGAAQGAKGRQEYLAQLSAATKSRTVLLNLLVGKDRTYIICTTPNTQTAQVVEISAADLNRLVGRFRAALTNPYADPRPLAKKLYDVLLKPLEADLAGAQAETLLVTLDGTVRYLPLCALSPDGVTYLIERYRFATDTGRGFQIAPLSAVPVAARVRGYGVTQAHTVTLDDGEVVQFGALAGVQNELSALPGAGSETLLDAQFTRDTFLNGTGAFPVVHIASHFRLGRDGAHSFLLCGDGSALTLAELAAQSRRFAGVDLLLLSACDTATAGIGGGGEVDSFALLAQEQGAQSVLASLWQVSDASTARLLTAFYRERTADPTLPKTEVLRRAQRFLISDAGVPGAVRGTPAPLPDAVDADVPAFVPDAAHPYAHPYYWAPFVLLGNAR